MPLLTVEHLSIGYQTPKGLLKAVADVSFSLKAGQSLGLVGESGCGKTTIGMALMGLLPGNGRVTAGRIILSNEELTAKSPEEMRRFRWKEVAMIFQAAMNALNPVHRVGEQMIEALLTHQPELGREKAIERSRRLFDLVGLDQNRFWDYPHQYSGGMKQRAIIAMALTCGPKLIVADEPTTALDVIVQDQILKEIMKLQYELNLSIIFISHDISIVAEVCDRIGVMYAGQLVEQGTTDEVFFSARHPYTKALLASFPTLGGERKKLAPIPGEPPNLIGAIPGCRFCDRCPAKEASCKLTPPEWKELSPSHHVLCDYCEMNPKGNP
jgi:peptide/nickel transport system ATP-binding protein